MANYWTASRLGAFESTFCAGCLVGVPGGMVVVLVRGGVGLEGALGLAVNSRHAIRERPHVSTISGIRWERGRGVVAVYGSYENCSVSKQSDCNAA